jgi:superfamily I DNA/RNA helicase
MQSHIAVLVLFARPENKKSLLRILEDLPVNVFGAATLAEAREVLSEQSISVVFCVSPTVAISTCRLSRGRSSHPFNSRSCSGQVSGPSI